MFCKDGGGSIIRKPRTRKERIKIIGQKLGIDFATGMYMLTDKEVKHIFELWWKQGLNNKEDYVDKTVKPAICLRCGEEVEFISICGCGERMAVISEDDWDEEEKPNNNAR